MKSKSIKNVENTANNSPESQVNSDNSVSETSLQSMDIKLGEKDYAHELDVNISRVTEMYSNHLDTIAIIFDAVVFNIGALVTAMFFLGTILAFFGWESIKKSIDKKVDEIIDGRVDKKIDEVAVKSDQGDDDIKEELKKLEATGFLSSAYQYMYSGSHADAITALTQAIDLNPNDHNTYIARSKTYVKLKAHDKALKDAEKAVELDPKSARAYKARGIARYYKEYYTEAINDLTKAIELYEKNKQEYPNYKGNARAYSNRGVTRAQLIKQNYNNETISDDDRIALIGSTKEIIDTKEIIEQAIQLTEQDLEKANSIKRESALYYYNKAYAHAIMYKPLTELIKNPPENVLDNIKESLSIAIRLNPIFAEKAMKSEGFKWLRENNQKFREWLKEQNR